MLNAPQSAPSIRAHDGTQDESDSFGEIGQSPAVYSTAAPPDFVAIAQSPEFRQLRRTLFRFAFPMSALFLGWYLAYVIVAAYQSEFMSIRLWGEINIGLVWGVGQFASTIVITALYLRFAARNIDPKVAALRSAVFRGDYR